MMQLKWEIGTKLTFGVQSVILHFKWTELAICKGTVITLHLHVVVLFSPSTYLTLYCSMGGMLDVTSKSMSAGPSLTCAWCCWSGGFPFWAGSKGGVEGGKLLPSVFSVMMILLLFCLACLHLRILLYLFSNCIKDKVNRMILEV